MKIKFSMDTLRHLIREELCKKNHQYDARKYKLEESDLIDEGGEWVRLRRDAFERLMKHLDSPPPPQSDLK